MEPIVHSVTTTTNLTGDAVWQSQIKHGLDQGRNVEERVLSPSERFIEESSIKAVRQAVKVNRGIHTVIRRFRECCPRRSLFFCRVLAQPSLGGSMASSAAHPTSYASSADVISTNQLVVSRKGRLIVAFLAQTNGNQHGIVNVCSNTTLGWRKKAIIGSILYRFVYSMLDRTVSRATDTGPFFLSFSIYCWFRL
jgi:hypothetical protein